MANLTTYPTVNGGGEQYVDRGDPASPDFEKGDLTADGSWHDLDLSSIVPSGAASRLVHLRVIVQDGSTNQALNVRTNGNSNEKATLSARTQEAGVRQEEDGFVKVDSARKVEYLLSNTVFDVVEITVRGWFVSA